MGRTERLATLEAENARLRERLALFEHGPERAAQEGLRRSERRLRIIQEATGLADFDTDEGGITSSNGRFFAQIGLPAQAEPMTFAEWLEHVHPDDRERLHEEVLRAMR